MSKTTLERISIVKLECGCIINDVSGELSQECLPHKEGNFIQ